MRKPTDVGWLLGPGRGGFSGPGGRGEGAIDGRLSFPVQNLQASTWASDLTEAQEVWNVGLWFPR